MGAFKKEIYMAQATKIQATTSLQHPHNPQGQLRRRKWLRQLFSFAFILPAVARVVGMVILPVGIGLAAAIMLQNLRGQAIFKNVFYLPYAIGLTSTGVIWTFLLSNDGLPTLLTIIGLKQFAHYNFLTSVPMNTFAMIIV